ncbi:MAG: PDC sensor domain-containing protein [Kiloniellales bacterium]|nr:PDC sensor domain-containing protein [Kiloniellales bacterium]
MARGSWLPVFFACGVGFSATVAVGHEAHFDDRHLEPVRAFADSQLKTWAAAAICIDAVKAQNREMSNITQWEIDVLDIQWRLETVRKVKPLINSVMSKQLSHYLAQLKESMRGAVTEIVIMDSRGLNVAASDIDSDYWQGDEAKWQKTYLAGPGSVFVDDVELDTSTDLFQSEISMAITDPVSGKVIGAIAVGIDLDRLADNAKSAGDPAILHRADARPGDGDVVGSGFNFLGLGQAAQ